MLAPGKLEDVKVVLADGCPALRYGLAERIALEGASIAGETGSGGSVVELVQTERPDFVILDPDLGGGLCKKIKSLPNPPLVIVYTNLASFADVALAMLSGADHYVHKSTELDELVQMGRRILEGESIWHLGPDATANGNKLRSAAKVSRLTRKERQVLRLMLRHHTNARIAERLHISLQTTKNHVGNVLRKLDCKKRTDLFSL